MAYHSWNFPQGNSLAALLMLRSSGCSLSVKLAGMITKLMFLVSSNCNRCSVHCPLKLSNIKSAGWSGPATQLPLHTRKYHFLKIAGHYSNDFHYKLCPNLVENQMMANTWLLHKLNRQKITPHRYPKIAVIWCLSSFPTTSTLFAPYSMRTREHNESHFDQFMTRSDGIVFNVL